MTGRELTSLACIKQRDFITVDKRTLQRMRVHLWNRHHKDPYRFVATAIFIGLAVSAARSNISLSVRVSRAFP